ncbi:peptidase U34 [Streptomonospora sp. PA3]|uniref:C69 family dipeptidase n=1 Tax=Streptomonospora sp. PA3 TaxID=2607326 RepID=UPI0012DEDB9F|nr:C69 family dipeptidase [Streptomonospora sp. PA3]MUL41451.1 peptidase U34 [Streptomonospora sp. PA3]
MFLPRSSGTTVGSAVVLALASVSPVSAGTSAEESPRPADPASPQAPGPAGADKSIGFYVGKNLTADGSVLIGGFGHEPSSHWLEIVDRRRHPQDAMITVGATEEASIPGRLTEIPQVDETAKYITMNYSEFAGFPAPLTNGGLNEHQVAARDIWSPSREELVEMTPTPQEGPQYSDLSRIAMERATSAREAVEIVGGLIDEYGYTTYGGNSHLFADENEGWVLVEFAGGEGLWAAERLGPDDVRVSYPGYIRDFPVDFAGDPDFMGSKNLVSFAEEQGWFDADGRQTIDLQEVYGAPFPGPPGNDEKAPFRYPPRLEDELRKLAPVRLEDMLRMVRDPRWSDDRSGYGQVAALRDDLANPDLATLWVAPTAAVTAPYIPWHIGARTIPPEYSQHRYLTSGAAANFMDPDHAHLEATRYPVRTFKRLMYYTCEHPRVFLGEVTRALEGFEARTLDRLGGVEDDARRAYEAGDAAEARGLLTDFSTTRAMDALALGEYLVDDVERRTKQRWGIRMPDETPPEGSTSESTSMNPNLVGEDVVVPRDRVNCDMGDGWAEGSTVDRQGTYGDPGAVPDYRVADGDQGGPAWPWGLGGAAGGLLVGAAAVYWLRRNSA